MLAPSNRAIWDLIMSPNALLRSRICRSQRGVSPHKSLLLVLLCGQSIPGVAPGTVYDRISVYGYQIAWELGHRSGGVLVSEGVLYPTLHQMAREGLRMRFLRECGVWSQLSIHIDLAPTGMRPPA